MTEIIWPTQGSGVNLAGLLSQAANGASGASNGSPPELVQKYLTWGTTQVRMLRGRVAAADMDRLVTTPRYWATVANPEPSPSTASAVLDELTTRAQDLEQAAAALRGAATSWKLADGRFSSLALIDTSFWMETTQPFGTIDWHSLTIGQESPEGAPQSGELRLVVPMLVIDELDGLTHRGGTRAKAVEASHWLYDSFREHPDGPVTVAKRARGAGPVTAQLLSDPPAHSRLPVSDAELISRTEAFAAFLGAEPWRTFFVTYDVGAAFRAAKAGLTPCLQRRPVALLNRTGLVGVSIVWKRGWTHAEGHHRGEADHASLQPR